MLTLVQYYLQQDSPPTSLPKTHKHNKLQHEAQFNDITSRFLDDTPVKL
jgi:hypothetical protein